MRNVAFMKVRAMSARTSKQVQGSSYCLIKTFLNAQIRLNTGLFAKTSAD